jgi:hypothetical protein
VNCDWPLLANFQRSVLNALTERSNRSLYITVLPLVLQNYYLSFCHGFFFFLLYESGQSSSPSLVPTISFFLTSYLLLSLQTVILLTRLFRASMPLAQIGQTTHPGKNVAFV